MNFDPRVAPGTRPMGTVLSTYKVRRGFTLQSFCITYSTSKYLALLHNVVGVAAGEASTLQQVHHITLAACAKRLHAIQGY